MALESETSVEGCSPPAPRCGSALSLPCQRLVRRSGTSATPQETALSGAFFRLSSGCLSTRLRREQSRQQLVSCSFPREPRSFKTRRRETRLGPNVPVFLVGLRKAALLGSPHRWLGIGLRVSLFLSFRSSEGSSLRPSLILLFGRSAVLLQRRVQVWTQRFHRVCSPCGVRNQRSVTPCSSSRTGGRSTVYGQRFQRLQPCNFSFPVCSCLFVLQLHFLAFSAVSSCFFQLLFQLSLRPHSRRRPRPTDSTQIGGFLKQTTTRNREILSSFLQSPLLLQCLLLPAPFRYQSTNLVAPPPGSTPRIWYSTTTPAAPKSVISSTFGCSDACSILLRQRPIYTPWSHHV